MTFLRSKILDNEVVAKMWQIWALYQASNKKITIIEPMIPLINTISPTNSLIMILISIFICLTDVYFSIINMENGCSWNVISIIFDLKIVSLSSTGTLSPLFSVMHKFWEATVEPQFFHLVFYPKATQPPLAVKCSLSLT